MIVIKVETRMKIISIHKGNSVPTKELQQQQQQSFKDGVTVSRMKAQGQQAHQMPRVRQRHTIRNTEPITMITTSHQEVVHSELTARKFKS